MSIILNEKSYVEDMLALPSPDNITGKNLWLVARYYHEQGCDKKKIESLLEQFLLRNDNHVNLIHMQPVIDRAVKNAGKKKLLQLNFVPITYAEMETVDSLESVRERKLLFALIALAKYSNEANDTDTGWVNMSIKDIFQTTGMYAMSKQKKHALIHSLYERGLINMSKRIDNMNLQIKCLNYDSDPCVKIYDFRNLGNQYLWYKGEPFCQCQVCGLIIKRTARQQKYCPDCSREIHMIQMQKRYHSSLLRA